MDPLEQLLSQVDDLPTLPDIYLRIADELSDPDFSLKKVGEMMAMDPVLSGRLIRIANSALFGASGRADSIGAAVQRLGARETRNMVMTAGVLNTLDTHKSPIDLRDFWTLGLASAICSRTMARDLRFPATDQAYLAGLVHCLGEAVLAIHLPERFQKAVADAHEEGCELVESVWSEFGFTYPVLTCKILERWNFPPALIEAVEYQLDPGEAPNQQLLASIILASDRICRELGMVSFDSGDEGRSWLPDVPSELIRLLTDQGYSDLDAYITELKTHVGDVGTLVNSIFGQR